jgi:hypothetical protein
MRAMRRKMASEKGVSRGERKDFVGTCFYLPEIAHAYKPKSWMGLS